MTVKVYTKDKPLFAQLKALPTDVLLKTSVHTVPFCTRALNVFDKKGIATLGDLVRLRKFDLLKMQNLGRTSIKQIEAYLAELGLSLGFRPEIVEPEADWLDDIVQSLKAKDDEIREEKAKADRLAVLLRQSEALLAEIKEVLR